MNCGSRKAYRVGKTLKLNNYEKSEKTNKEESERN